MPEKCSICNRRIKKCYTCNAPLIEDKAVICFDHGEYHFCENQECLLKFIKETNGVKKGYAKAVEEGYEYKLDDEEESEDEPEIDDEFELENPESED